MHKKEDLIKMYLHLFISLQMHSIKVILVLNLGIRKIKESFMFLLRSVIIAVLCIFLTTACSNLETTDSKSSDSLGSIYSEDINNADGEIENRDLSRDNRGSDSFFSPLKTIYFPYNSSDLSAESKRNLISNAKWIQSKSNLKKVELEGHCDNLGSSAFNIGLGLRRAQAVKDFLISSGISSTLLSTLSYGEERPVSDDNYAKNRRVILVPIY